MRIFVGNIAFSASDEDLARLFEPFGKVYRAYIATDRTTGRPRGFGFVEMLDEAEAQAAIAGLHGTSLDGRPLTVNEARPRPERERPGPRW